MNSANYTVQCSAAAAAARPVDNAEVVCGDMPDVVRPAPTDGHQPASDALATASGCRAGDL